MKVNLVVTQGVHAGKKIPVSVASEFFIGRDPQCQLRPASPSISKQHCGIVLRGTEVLVRDCGSTNGTFVNNEQIAGERTVANGDTLRVGPLEFTLSIEVPVPSVTETVNAKAATADTLVAKPVAKVAVAKAAVAVAAKVETAVAKASDTTVDADADAESMAAMMLFEDAAASGTPTVENFNAESTTVMEMPALGAAAKPGDASAGAKKEEKKVHGDSSSAAAEALSKYMRRPRT